jgi:hypothetical protein
MNFLDATKLLAGSITFQLPLCQELAEAMTAAVRLL